MENTEIMAKTDVSMLENVLVNGDLSKLNAGQRLDYYRQVCQSMGLNPLSRPFDYITLNNRLTLYAKKDATDQLRKIHTVSIDDIDIREDNDGFTVKVKGHDNTGRSDVEIGCVAKKEMNGNAQNAKMKAVTKAKRRLTLSLCGLGWLDESEVETIPNAKPVVVDDKGEIVEAPKLPENAFDEKAFLDKFEMPGGLPYITPAKAENEIDRNNMRYGDLNTATLAMRMRTVQKSLERIDITPDQKDDRLYKLSVICTVLNERKHKSN
jgi:hypothetical protein